MNSSGWKLVFWLYFWGASLQLSSAKFCWKKPATCTTAISLMWTALSSRRVLLSGIPLLFRLGHSIWKKSWPRNFSFLAGADAEAFIISRSAQSVWGVSESCLNNRHLFLTNTGKIVSCGKDNLNTNVDYLGKRETTGFPQLFFPWICKCWLFVAFV